VTLHIQDSAPKIEWLQRAFKTQPVSSSLSNMHTQCGGGGEGGSVAGGLAVEKWGLVLLSLVSYGERREIFYVCIRVYV